MRAYLFVIVRNLYRDRLRQKGRTGPLNGALHEPRPGPASIASDREALDHVLAAMQQLPEPDRAVLAMAALASMPYDQIAAAFEASVPAIKVRVHRARLKLNIIMQSNPASNAP